MLRKFNDFLTNVYYRIINSLGIIFLKIAVREKDFTIFSNDCYGGEVYKWMNLPFNTPFIGLMIMIPCYVKLLKKPRYYFSLPLNFVNESQYAEMNTFRLRTRPYPLAKIDDIEIHFLHYHSNREAKEKWEKRIKRINWSNIKVKFSMDKDYATEDLLRQFEELSYQHKISFSKNKFSFSQCNHQLKNYSDDAIALFRNSLKEINLIKFLNKGHGEISGLIDKISGYALFFFLKRP